MDAFPPIMVYLLHLPTALLIFVQTNPLDALCMKASAGKLTNSTQD